MYMYVERQLVVAEGVVTGKQGAISFSLKVTDDFSWLHHARARSDSTPSAPANHNYVYNSASKRCMRLTQKYIRHTPAELQVRELR